MTNAFAIAQRLGLTGEPSQIVSQLVATGLTARPIKLDELLFLLNNRGMLIELIRPADTGEKWSGTVVNMVLYLNASGTPEQAAAVNQWFSHISNARNNLFDTTQPAFAGAFWSLARSFGGQPGFPSSADFEAVAALGGGWLFADLTVETYQDQKVAYEAEQAQAALDSEWVSLQNDGDINAAVAAGDRPRLKAALAAAIEVL